MIRLYRPSLGMHSSGRDPFDDRYWGGSFGKSDIGVTVTLDRANQVPVIKNCRQMISDSVAGLEFVVFRKTGPHTTERLTDHPILRLFENPNSRQTSFDFIKHIVDDLVSAGDFYGEQVFSERGELSEIRRLDPDPSRMQVDETPDGVKRFHSTDRQGRTRVLLEDEVWHIPLPPLVDNLRGRSPILHDGVEAVAVAIALQRYANSLFTNDATPSFVFKMGPGQKFEDEKSKENFLNAWFRKLSGRNRGRPGMLENGMEAQRLGLTNEEAQFLETRKELWLDLCRLWNMPPHKVGILDKASFSNIEHQGLEYVVDVLRPVLELVERSIKKFLIAERDVHFQFNVDSLLRGDIKTRYEAYAIGRQWGWLSVNDVLEMERRNGIGRAGDRHVEPLNMVAVDDDRSRDPQSRAAIEDAKAFLRQSVKGQRGPTRLELVKDAA